MILQHYALLILLALAALYLILILNAKSQWQRSILQETSSLLAGSMPRSSAFNRLYKYLLDGGYLLARLLPSGFVQQREFMYRFIQRDFRDFYISLSQSLGIFVIFVTLALWQRNILFVLCALFFAILLICEADLAYKMALDQIDKSIKHITQCLEILLVRTETPVINALEIIAQGLDIKYKYGQQELRRIVNKASKAGLEAALVDYSAGGGSNMKEFVSMLISVSDGANKKAIGEQITKFLEAEKLREDEVQKSISENLQLYLMLPVIFMLIVLMLPMADAINYGLQNTGFVNG